MTRTTSTGSFVSCGQPEAPGAVIEQVMARLCGDRDVRNDGVVVNAGACVALRAVVLRVQRGSPRGNAPIRDTLRIGSASAEHPTGTMAPTWTTNEKGHP